LTTDPGTYPVGKLAGVTGPNVIAVGFLINSIQINWLSNDVNGVAENLTIILAVLVPVYVSAVSTTEKSVD